MYGIRKSLKLQEKKLEDAPVYRCKKCDFAFLHPCYECPFSFSRLSGSLHLPGEPKGLGHICPINA